MKTKKQHLKALRDIQKSIVKILDRVDKEAHIPVWKLRMWGSNIKSVANFMRKEREVEKQLRDSMP